MKGVHLLAYHIGALTDATAEQIRCLQQRRPYLTETRTLKMLPSHAVNGLPALKLLWQQIYHASEALELTHVQNAFTPT